MQDNAPLMTALAKLIAVNMPDLVLFVGEALVGNEAVDQLVRTLWQTQTFCSYTSCPDRKCLGWRDAEKKVSSLECTYNYTRQQMSVFLHWSAGSKTPNMLVQMFMHSSSTLYEQRDGKMLNLCRNPPFSLEWFTPLLSSGKVQSGSGRPLHVWQASPHRWNCSH